ncbi:Chorismate mutase [Paenibacillus nuruki]|uniref:chorismate mutase n=1 Tax=Paenibacillus nuruki TaxID=1886670 RepID=A0A1E3L2R9_9BACL|nr:chorismate mutase [Paenibacillus nuruki]ODP28092.1 Chorismate mutase [Paenibacillus nuruki]
MYNRGIRGATTVINNEKKEILDETVVLLKEIVDRNQFEPEDISCIWITMTPDLDAIFPALAIREMEGWNMVPLMCAVEAAVQNSLPQCIRLMIQVNTTKSQQEIRHVYLNEAKRLRPDLALSE